ncbi:hypothetical protein FRB98_004535 [Tulasnella sp. 332]|nr:hypothetical protein FRB98_004535 [Tulasnella sp. 332]
MSLYRNSSRANPPNASYYGTGPQPVQGNRPGSTYGNAPQPAQGTRPGSLYGRPGVSSQAQQAPPHRQSAAYTSGWGQAPPPQPPRMPPGADPQLWGWFQSVDEDRSGIEWLRQGITKTKLTNIVRIMIGAITPDELSRALVNGNWTPFDLDTVRMLMGLFDTDRSGTIGFQEFVSLWKYIAEWQKVFRHFDQDHSGTIEGTELASAIKQFGFNLSPNLLMLLEQKYASLPSAAGAPGGISFDRFVRACVMVKTLTEAFQRVDTDRDGWININYEEFMRIILTAP